MVSNAKASLRTEKFKIYLEMILRGPLKPLILSPIFFSGIKSGLMTGYILNKVKSQCPTSFIKQFSALHLYNTAFFRDHNNLPLRGGKQ